MTFRLPADLQFAFIAACKAHDRTAAQELRSFMRSYIKENAQGELALAPVAVKKGGKNAK